MEFISNETYLLIRGMCQRYVGTLPFKLKKQMRKIFTLFLLLLIPLWMQAQDDDIWDEETKTLTVILGETTEYGSYKELAEHLVIKAGTNSTAIGDRTFFAWPVLQTIEIEGNVTSIGDHSFSECKELISVTISEGVKTMAGGAFERCSNLKNIQLSSTLNSLGAYAFAECFALDSITIPAGIKTIEQNTFFNCDGLIEVTISEGVTVIKASAFFSMYLEA